MRATVLLVVGAVCSFLLQIAIAPNIAILGAMPNFVLVYVGVAAMVHHDDSVLVTAFFLGLALDLLGSGTIGVMAALLALVAFVASRAAVVFGSETVTISLMISMTCSLLVEVCYAFVYVAAANVSPIDALLMRALPCALYDCAMGLIFFPLLSNLFARSAPSHKAPQSSTIRLR